MCNFFAFRTIKNSHNRKKIAEHVDSQYKILLRIKYDFKKYNNNIIISLPHNKERSNVFGNRGQVKLTNKSWEKI